MKVTIGNMTFESDPSETVAHQKEQMDSFLKSAERIEESRAKSPLIHKWPDSPFIPMPYQQGPQCEVKP